MAAAVGSLRWWTRTTALSRSFSSILSSSSSRNPDSRLRLGLRLPEPEPEDGEAPKNNKSRNEKKREAKRSVRWAMDLAQLPPPQIKQILNIAQVEDEVFEALMLVKRLGPDVKEGKRRQYNYIGKLLRDTQPELIDTLIQASKDGDSVQLHSFSGKESWPPESEELAIQIDQMEEEGERDDYFEIVNRWFEGLVNRNSLITNEVYALHNVDFDRQELRKLVRRLQSLQANQLAEHNVVDELASKEITYSLPLWSCKEDICAVVLADFICCVCRCSNKNKLLSHRHRRSTVP